MAAELVEPRGLGASECKHERRHLRQFRRDELEQHDRVVVGRLQVVEHDQQRLPRGLRSQRLGDGFEEAEPCFGVGRLRRLQRLAGVA